MENFIDSFNIVNTGFAAIILVILSIIMVISACIYFDKLEEEIKEKKLTKDSKEYKKIVKIETISSILIFSIILISCILIFCHPKNNHINDLKTNYNITINDYQITFNIKDKSLFMKDLKEHYNIEIKDNQVTFTLKNSNIELRKTKTFNVIKENDNKYIFENVKKPYIRYELTEDEFREIFNKSNKPINAVTINNEIKTYN